ncbi:RluA family pseudouridine synthase [Niallia sp. MER 6]|uniref:RluA family pseudouridine synthase n=1 Tax=Niallia sp. MER 6 TaxID=2939567 RepID=UPI0037CC9870
MTLSSQNRIRSARHVTFKLDWVMEEDGKIMLKEFLKERSISKSALTDIKFKGGRITVNEVEQNVRYMVKRGDRISVLFPVEKPSEGLLPEEIPLNIIYEDDYLLIVEKPSGMNTIPSREHPSGSLANAVFGYYVKKGIAATTHIVTRLDRDTSGMVLIAKHRHVHHLLSEQQKARLVKRHYTALAEGLFSNKSGTINAPIGRCGDSIIKREVREDGQTAITHYNVLTQLSDFAAVELSLETGRTHQIRVHMSYISHPLIGDDLYGGSRYKLGRQALHCSRLAFIHPITQQEMEFSISLPEDMKRLFTLNKQAGT